MVHKKLAKVLRNTENMACLKKAKSLQNNGSHLKPETFSKYINELPITPAVNSFFYRYQEIPCRLKNME
jgi:hypothetical protein